MKCTFIPDLLPLYIPCPISVLARLLSDTVCKQKMLFLLPKNFLQKPFLPTPIISCNRVRQSRCSVGGLSIFRRIIRLLCVSSNPKLSHGVGLGAVSPDVYSARSAALYVARYGIVTGYV